MVTDLNTAERQEEGSALEVLLQPIADDTPAGESLRYESAFDEIKEARREDDTLPRGIWQTDLKKADWQKVAQICQDTLKGRSKDLQVAAWLSEAWLRLEGLPGLAQGLELIRELIVRYWDTIHPQIENGDLEFRFAPLEWINDQLSELIRFINVSHPPEAVAPSYTLADIHEANALDKNARRHKEGEKIVRQAEDEGKPTLAKIAISFTQTPTPFFKTVITQTMQCMKQIQALEAGIFQYTPKQMPSFYKIQAALNELKRHAETHLKNRGIHIGEGPADIRKDTQKEGPSFEDENDLTDVHVITSDAFQFTPITTRAEAYARLVQAADYLIRVEPHSPAPYLVKRAVAWGSMTLTELYQEIIQNENDLAQLKQLLGVPKNKPIL